MRTPTILGVLLAGGIALAGCTPSEGPSEQPSSPGTPPPPSAIMPASQSGPKADVSPQEIDREFARELVSHHQVAKQLVDLAKRGTEEEEFKEYAEQVEKTEEPIAEQARTWLVQHEGEPGVRAALQPSVGTSTWMPPANPAAVQALGEARGKTFEATFADSLYDHSNQMVEMAGAQLGHGGDPQLKALAQQIDTTYKPLRAQAEEIRKKV